MFGIARFRHYGYSCALIVCLGGICFNTVAAEKESEKGRVSMQGSIISTPCAISTADREQTIDMGIATVSEIVHDGFGVPHPFSFSLVNCDLSSAPQPEGQYFQTTFDGPVKDGVFQVSGAEGIGLQILDAEGNIAVPGQPMAGKALVSGSQRLDYVLRLVDNHQDFRPGEYHTTLRFKVDYF